MENIIEQQVEIIDMEAFTDSMEEEFDVDNIVIDETMIVDNMVHTLVHNVQGSNQDATLEDLEYMVNDDQLEIESPNEMDDAFNQWYDEFIEDLVEETDLNVAPWLQWEENNHAKTVAESASTGTQIYDMGATDANGDQLTFSLYNDPTGKLTIDPVTGIITLNEAFDNVSTDTNYNVWIQVSDGSLTDLDYLTLTVSADAATQYTKNVSTGGIATWGAKFSEDTVQDNLWANQTALVISNGNYGNLRDNVVNLLGAEGLTVTQSTQQGSIDTWADVNKYSQIWNLNWADHANSGSPGSYSTNVKNAYEDYLQAGGSLYLGGELNGSIYNVINDSVVSTVQQVGGNMSYGSTVTSAVDLNAAYRVGPITSSTSGKITPSAAVINTSDGNYMTSNNISAEWGPEVLNNNIQGTVMAHMDFNYATSTGWPNASQKWADLVSTYSNWLQQESENNASIATYDTEYIPLFADSYGTAAHTIENDITEVEAFHLGDNVYIGGGLSHIDWAWDDSADTAYWAFNGDMDDNILPQQQDDHYGVIGYDKDGDGDLWETTDTFSLDKIKILDNSVDYMAQDADATSSYYFKVTPVKYSGGAWTFDTGHTVTVTNTTDYNQYLDLTSNTDFDNINYALIETESALISEVVVTA
jgi:hypothetical protein